jgi:hypothetical protein
MFNQYGSVLCILCGSSMRLATIEPGEAGTSMETFECRYAPCARSRVTVIGKPQLGQNLPFGIAACGLLRLRLLGNFVAANSPNYFIAGRGVGSGDCRASGHGVGTLTSPFKVK